MSVKTRPCAICLNPIEAERLEIMPETRLCLEHAQQIKKYGGEFTLSATQERTSKAGSLKKNYGGVNTTRTRNVEGLKRLKEEYDRLNGGQPAAEE